VVGDAVENRAASMLSGLASIALPRGQAWRSRCRRLLRRPWRHQLGQLSRCLPAALLASRQHHRALSSRQRPRWLLYRLLLEPVARSRTWRRRL